MAALFLVFGADLISKGPANGSSPTRRHLHELRKEMRKRLAKSINTSAIPRKAFWTFRERARPRSTPTL